MSLNENTPTSFYKAEPNDIGMYFLFSDYLMNI